MQLIIYRNLSGLKFKDAFLFPLKCISTCTERSYSTAMKISVKTLSEAKSSWIINDCREA